MNRILLIRTDNERMSRRGKQAEITEAHDSKYANSIEISNSKSGRDLSTIYPVELNKYLPSSLAYNIYHPICSHEKWKVDPEREKESQP